MRSSSPPPPGRRLASLSLRIASGSLRTASVSLKIASLRLKVGLISSNSREASIQTLPVQYKTRNLDKS